MPLAARISHSRCFDGVAWAQALDNDLVDRLLSMFDQHGYLGSHDSAALKISLQAMPRQKRQTMLRAFEQGARLVDLRGALDQLSAAAWLNLIACALIRAQALPQGARVLSLQSLNAALVKRSAETIYQVRLLDNFLIHASVNHRALRIDVGISCPAQLTFTTSKRDQVIIALAVGLKGMATVTSHAALKELLDALGLSRGTYDRVGNKSVYLARMSHVRDDKVTMMKYVRAGNILEVGPAGAAILTLLQAFKESSRILGLELSEEALSDLAHRRQRNGLTYELLRGDALNLQSILAEEKINGLDTVIFCSVLHEVFSYTRFEGRQFNLRAVRAVLSQAVQALRPGGRLIIRDWVIPDDAAQTRHLVFKTTSASDLFNHFVNAFKGRSIEFTEIRAASSRDRRSVALSAGDAMEFMYKLSWGPESFVYEVREQYGFFSLQGCIDAVTEIAGELGVGMQLKESASHLQEGYRNALSDKLELCHEDGTYAAWPPSKALWVFEKTERPFIRFHGPH